MDAIKAISYSFNLSPKRQEYLEKVIKENFPEVTRKKLLDVCRTRWLERINGVDLFEDFSCYTNDFRGDIFLTWKISIIRTLLLKQTLF